MTTLTLVTALVVVYGLLGPKGYVRALSLGAATPAGAAVAAGAVAVPTFYAVALGAVCGVALRFLRRTRYPEPDLLPVPGVSALALLVPVAVVVTLVAPLLFNGLTVLSSTGEPLALSAGLLTKSNLAQIVYLVISVSVVVYLARSPHAGPEVVGIAVCLVVLLSAWAYLGTTFGAPYPAGLFDNSPTFVFQETLESGAPRVRGILSEPSALGASSLAAIAYCAARVRTVTGLHRAGLLAVLATAAYLGFIATSATFFVAGAALAVLATLVFFGQFVLRSGPLSRVGAALLCAAAVASLWVLPLVSTFLDRIVDDKVASSSYTDRSSADATSYQLVWETLGLGTGLGSNRGSSFAASLLSTVGVVGTLLLAVAVWVLVRESWPDRRYRPVVWSLAALLISKVVSGPDLADSSGVLWMSLGVLAHAALQRAQARARGLAAAPASASGAPAAQGGPRAP